MGQSAMAALRDRDEEIEGGVWNDAGHLTRMHHAGDIEIKRFL